jgi:hypothetical protein
MEEILASIRRIISDDQDVGRERGRTAALNSGPVAAATSVASPRERLLERVSPRPPLHPLDLPSSARDDLEHEEEEEEELDADAALELAPAVDEAPPVAPTSAGAHARPSWTTGSSPEPRPAADDAGPLLSGAAQATAAQAFQRLSATVRDQQPRSLEDVVAEMLRPMLKAWLDENLPPLVERLVRAEIERVARGGR